MATTAVEQGQREAAVQGVQHRFAIAAISGGHGGGIADGRDLGEDDDDVARPG